MAGVTTLPAQNDAASTGYAHVAVNPATGKSRRPLSVRPQHAGFDIDEQTLIAIDSCLVLYHFVPGIEFCCSGLNYRGELDDMLTLLGGDNGVDALSAKPSQRTETVPNSQESSESVYSAGSSVPGLQSSSSNLSNITIPDSVQTSPMSSAAQLVQASKRTASGTIKPSPTSPTRPQIGHSRNTSTDTNASRVGEVWPSKHLLVHTNL